MLIMRIITANMGNNLKKSYSKYENHPRMFATARSDLVLARRRRKKKKKGKKVRNKTLDQKHNDINRFAVLAPLGSHVNGNM